MLGEIAELQFGSSWNKLQDESGTVSQLDDNSIAHLRETLNTINRELLSSPDRYRSLNAEYLSRQLGQQVVAGIVASKPIRLSKPDKKRRQALSNALDHMEVNYDELLSIKQLSKVAGTSQRTLEYIFQDKYQVSPKTFLIARRLHTTRQQLLQSQQKENRIIEFGYTVGVSR
jgi:AraC-like DNA-binding protein